MTRSMLRTAVVEALAELTGCSAESVRDTDDLIDDLGVDSMMSVNLVVAIEDRIGTPLPSGYESSLVDVRTVEGLVECLASAFAGPEPVRDFAR